MDKKIAIYTCLTGGYDILQEPAVVDTEHFDYFVFTDDVDAVPPGSIWQAILIPELQGKNTRQNRIRRARRAKLLPHEILPGYDWSVFMDANLRITGEEFYAIVLGAVLDEKVFSGLRHPLRDCVYDELRECYLKDRISTREAFRHHRFFRSIGMSRHAGLLETNVLLRNHLRRSVIELDSKWWRILSDGSTRDQLALTPALSLLGYRLPVGEDNVPSYLLDKSLSARNVPFIEYTKHTETHGRVPGRIDFKNLRYNIRLGFRKLVLWLFLK